jgi:hypothetical protein
VVSLVGALRLAPVVLAVGALLASTLTGAGAAQGEDCAPTAAQATTLPAPGYRLPDGDFVSQSEVRASPDGRFWQCRGSDGGRSFFAPSRP